jgi:hypothetical protein
MLNKAYGLRILMTVTGKAGKFDAFQLLLTIGACLGLLSISSLLAEILTWTFTFKKTTQLAQNLLKINSLQQNNIKPEFSNYNVYPNQSNLRNKFHYIDNIDLEDLKSSNSINNTNSTNQMYMSAFPISDE